ncbi:MAG: hypothetical protein EPN79_15765 [Burkholderiaceae bacterium]|nr:MAG: hypothetical protein EPN79_15765 [Burkholderiaceae bacterium]
MISYADWEQLMVLLAEDRGWEFTFDGEYVPAAAVFNASSYGPVLLTAAAQELHLRQIRSDMAIALHGDRQSLFGARVDFDPRRNSIDAQIWRLHTTATLIESLPKHNRAYQLDPLAGVLPSNFQAYIAAEVE